MSNRTTIGNERVSSCAPARAGKTPSSIDQVYAEITACPCGTALSVQAIQKHIAPPELRPELQLMLQELADFGLEVALIPAPEPMHGWHFVRAVWCHNPGWYRDLCAAYPRRRRNRKARYVDPLFKRDDVVGVIRRLLGGGLALLSGRAAPGHRPQPGRGLVRRTAIHGGRQCVTRSLSSSSATCAGPALAAAR